ncbi:eukaryotic translation initiation factor 3 subunit D, partial [Jimgerdemannia flammicorona]
MADETPRFSLPTIFDNDLGWGPASNVLPEQFRDIPYAPYSKADKLGRIADWSLPDQNKDGQRDQNVGGRGSGRQGYNRYNRDQYQAYGSGVSSAFAYTHNEDEASFSVVDNRSAAAKKSSSFRGGASGRGNRGGQRGGAQGYGRGGGQGGQSYGRQGLQAMRDNFRGGRGGRGGNQGRRRFGWKDYDK